MTCLSRGLVGFILLVSGVAYAQSQPARVAQRTWFVQAEKAIAQNRPERYRQLRAKLQDYPLLPYLDMETLEHHLPTASASEVQRFLRKYHGTPVATGLRWDWLDLLAKRRQWKAYLAFYTPQESVSRQCDHLHALLATGRQQQAWPAIEQTWLDGSSQPHACDPVFAAWEAAGKRTPALTWKRIELAMDAGNWRLARYLGKSLGATDRAWLSRWIAIYRSPEKVLRSREFRQPFRLREKMLASAVRHQAVFDGVKALDLWQAIDKRYPFDADTRYRTARRIAVALERVPGPRAYHFILGLKPRADDDRLYDARRRAELLRQDWRQLLTDIDRGPIAAAQQERWHYWKARALQAIGKTREADKLYRQLAKERSYYGFLSADRVGMSYQLKHSDTPVDKAALRQMRQVPGVQRALELYALGRDLQARREWNVATFEISKVQLKAAAVIAERANWDDQAIFTLARAGYWDDLELRFPLDYQSLVEHQAKAHRLDESWIFAVIRQESAFMADARSVAGAVGLMQLLPSTARQVARTYLKCKPPHGKTLYRAKTNIELGSAYLRQLLDRWDNSPVLATAAYNAGPRTVSQWLPPSSLPADIWIDLVPYQETQRYLHRVLSYMVIYDKRLGRQPTRLSQRMPQISAVDLPGGP